MKEVLKSYEIGKMLDESVPPGNAGTAMALEAQHAGWTVAITDELQKMGWKSAGYMRSTLNLGSNLAERTSPSSTKKFIVLQKRGARTRKQVAITSVITRSKSEANMQESTSRCFNALFPDQKASLCSAFRRPATDDLKLADP